MCVFIIEILLKFLAIMNSEYGNNINGKCRFSTEEVPFFRIN